MEHEADREHGGQVIQFSISAVLLTAEKLGVCCKHSKYDRRLCGLESFSFPVTSEGRENNVAAEYTMCIIL